MAKGELVMIRSGIRFPSPAPSAARKDGTSCEAASRRDLLKAGQAEGAPRSVAKPHSLCLDRHLACSGGG
jgi:hypothetical protein